MSREEMVDTLLDLIIKNSSNIEDAKDSIRQMSYTQAINLIEELIKHEQDTLKEFVKYLKDKIEDARNILFWENENMYAINVGIAISTALENFLKEKENNEQKR